MDDKLLHFVIAFVAGVIITRVVKDPLDLGIIALFCLAAILFEFYQESHGVGTFEVGDIIASCVGAFGAFVVVKETQRIKRKKRNRRYYG